MSRFVIVPRPVAIALGAVTLFAIGGIAIGAMLAAGSDRVAAAVHGSARDYTIGGIAIAMIGLAVAIWAARRWTALRVLEREDDALIGTSFLGRRVRIALPCTLELSGKRVVFTFGAAPRIQDVVSGALANGDGRWRLAASGPVTYEAVLRLLGVAGDVPRRGRARYDLARVA